MNNNNSFINNNINNKIRTLDPTLGEKREKFNDVNIYLINGLKVSENGQSFCWLLTNLFIPLMALFLLLLRYGIKWFLLYKLTYSSFVPSLPHINSGTYMNGSGNQLKKAVEYNNTQVYTCDGLLILICKSNVISAVLSIGKRSD